MPHSHLQHFEAHTLLIAATRYFMGRRTIAAGHFAQHELAAHWDKIPEQTQRVIQRDLEEAFKSDDEARANGDSFRWLGDDCDRAAWDCVRQAYSRELPE